MSNKEERMNRNKSIIEDYQTKAGKAHDFNRGRCQQYNVKARAKENSENAD